MPTKLRAPPSATPPCSAPSTRPPPAWARACCAPGFFAPKLTAHEIEARLDAVAELKSQHHAARGDSPESRGVQDLERLASRATLGVATPRDLVGAAPIRGAHSAAAPLSWPTARPPASSGLSPCMPRWTSSPTCSSASNKRIAEDPPALASDPGVIRRGFDAELDELRDLSQHSRQIIAAMEERERKRTGNRLAEDSLQPGLRLLYRNLQAPICIWRRRISSASKPWPTPSASPRPS